MSLAVNLRISLFTMAPTKKKNLQIFLPHPIHQIENHLGYFFAACWLTGIHTLYKMLTLLVPQQQHHEWIFFVYQCKKKLYKSPLSIQQQSSKITFFIIL